MRNWRFILVFASVFIFAAVIIGRLIFLQVFRADFYRAMAQGLRVSISEVWGDRGEIFFRNGEPLAVNVDYPYIFASPKEIEDNSSTARILSQVLNMDESDIMEKLADKESAFSAIKEKLTEEEIKKIGDLNIKGLYLDNTRSRYYPQELLAGPVAGFLNEEGFGQYGLEEFYDDVLRGQEGGGNKGQSFLLALDYRIQFEAEKLLRERQAELQYKEAQILVVEPDTCKIVAMANYPSFDPNRYVEYADGGNMEVFKNSLTQDLFEPGSIFKPFTIASALEEGKVSPQTTFNDEGPLKIDGYTVENYDKRHYGLQTMTNVLEKSINTGAVFVQKQLGQSLFLRYVEKFGFTEPTGLGLNEAYSENSEVKKGRDINLASASFGQGIAVTPVQLIRAYCAILNGGKLVKPFVVQEPFDEDVNEDIPQVISSKTSAQLKTMLLSVVENGYGKSARIPGYYVGGKTGTAQVSYSSLGIPKKGYSEETIQSFVGFAPALNPKFVILVKLNNPKTNTAEYSAIPIFHDLAEFIINYWEIPPDYEQTK